MRVKPLEWEPKTGGCTATGLGINYAMGEEALGLFCLFNPFHTEPMPKKQVQALAQADYEARIRASLASEATPVAVEAEGEPVARLAEEQNHLLMCAAENLRGGGSDDRRAEAAFRMAHQMDEWRKSAALLAAPPAPTHALKALSYDVLSHAQMLLLAVEAGDPTRELAMRVKDLIAAIRAKEPT